MQEYYLNSEKKICLMELSEFKELEGAYPHKRNLFRSMNPVQYCKAESYGDCLFGTMKIPRALKGRVTYIVFGFYLRGEELLLIDVQQNKVMSILTVVTTIFLPLTLIAGWYGMNFPNMPEFGWKYAYPVVIVVSICIIAGEIIYFKKKKML